MSEKRLVRSQDERMFAGVAGGVAEYFNADPTLIRLVFVGLTFFKGIGPLIYFVLWVVMPVKDGATNPADRDKPKTKAA